jgi:hypothetical protein
VGGMFTLEQQLLKKIMSSVEKHTTINNKEKLKEEIKTYNDFRYGI